METDRHYILTDEFKINEKGVKLYRIKCTENFSEIQLGDLGGFIESYENLSGRAWVFHEAEVYGNARVFGDAWVFHEAEVYGNARVFGDAWVTADAKVYGNAEIFGSSMVYGEAGIFGNAKVCGHAKIFGSAEVYGNAEISENAWVYGDACIYGDAWVAGHSIVCGDTEVCDNAEISGNVKLCSNVAISGNAELMKSSDYSCFQSFGSVGRTTIVFREKGNIIKINCGCFSGPVEEFEKKVEEKHGDSKFGREYKAIINVIKIKFNLD